MLNINILLFTYFILIVAIACFRKYTLAGALSIFAVCHVSLSYIRIGFAIPPLIIICLMFLFFLSCVYFLYLYNKSLGIELENIERETETQEEQLTALTHRDDNLKGKNSQLERSLNEIVKIYEYVKKLGSTMDFNEAIETLETTLKLLTPFSTGKLILVENNDISKVYKLPSSHLPINELDISNLKEFEKKLTFKLLKSPQILLYEKGKLSPLGNLPNNIETLITLPLVIENQLVGLLTLENIPLINIDKIHFITLQFAMEVKKTQLYEKVKELSTIDGLTQLYLRRHFMNLFINELDRGYRQNQPLSFLMIDIDYFKRYNDEYGHLAGDLVLKKVAGILKDKSREIDLLCRYGGDEFAFVLPRTIITNAHTVAERLRRTVNEYLFQVAKERFQISVSIGISSCNPKDMQLDSISETLIDLADKALYQAKSQGRNRVILSR